MPKPAVFLAALATLLACALGAWVAFAPLDEVVRGVGRIVPQSHTQLIQHLEGGIVDEILVREGQVVKHGQPLFRLHDQSARTERDEQAIGAQALAFKQARLQAEQDGAATLTLPADASAKFPDLAQNEQQLFAARQSDLQHQVSILREQMNQKQLQMADVKAQVASLRAEQSTAQKQLEINTKLRQGGALSESRLLESQAQVQNLSTRIAQAEGQVPVLQAEVNELAKRERQLREERKSKVADELATVNVQLQQLGEREKSLGDKLKRTLVVAPANGIINKLGVTTVGGVVQPGAVLAELTPTDGGLLLEGKVAARDRARVWNGQQVTVRISAYDYASYGSLEGTVRDVSADTFKEEQGGTFYRVLIDLPHASMAGPGNGEQPLMPGMTADFYVKGARQTALWELTSSFRKIFMY